MLNQLLKALRNYAARCKEEVKKGRYSGKFAAGLIQTYAKTMMKALKATGKGAYVFKIQAETDKLCQSVYPEYRPKLAKLIVISKKLEQLKSSQEKATALQAPVVPRFKTI